MSALTRGADDLDDARLLPSIGTTAAACCWAADWLDVSERSATTSSGPLKPGPNVVLIASNVARWVVPLAADPLSGSARRA